MAGAKRETQDAVATARLTRYTDIVRPLLFRNMDSAILKESRLIWWLLGYRSLLTLFALYSIIEKPVRMALPAIFVLGALLLVGESVYKILVAHQQRMLELQKERELRELRAEEARLRMEAFKRAQAESAKEFEVFDRDKQAEPDAPSASAAKEEVPAP